MSFEKAAVPTEVAPGSASTRVFDEQDLIASATYENPYPVYAALRDKSPFRYLSIRGDGTMGRKEPVWTWAVMNYDAVCAVLRDHQTFSAKDPLAGQLGPKLTLVNVDPPRHTQLRRLVQSSFNHAGVQALEPWISSLSARLLDETAGEVDMIAAYAAPLPVQVIAHLLGIPAEDHAKFRRWSNAYVSLVPTRASERMRAIREMTEYFRQRATARRSSPASDLIGTLVSARIEGQPLEDWEVVGFCLVLLIAGNETTTSLIGNMLGILADHPELWRRLRDDRSLVEPLIEETLRYHSPIQRSAFRVATRDTELGGVAIKEGDRVTVFYGAANRDPLIFETPGDLCLDKRSSEHVAFGLGPHFCLGAELSRLEARITLNALLDRFSAIARGRAAAVRQNESPVSFGFSRLPLVFE